LEIPSCERTILNLITAERPLTILMDMDGVGYEYIGGYTQAMRKLYPEVPLLRPEERTRFDQLSGPEVSGEMVKAGMNAPGLFLGLDLLPGYLQAIQEMDDEGHHVLICTSPTVDNPTCAQDKYDAIARDLGERWRRRMILTSDKTVIQGDYLFDDHPEIVGAGVPAWTQILVDQPYNAYRGEALTRISDLTRWRESIHAAVSRGLAA
jgi:5'-nucleotidase